MSLDRARAAMRLLVLVAALALAGCVQLAPQPPATPEPDLDLPWTLTKCRYVVGWSGADPAKVQAQLPEGFRVAPGSPLGLPVPVEEVIIGTEAFECEEGSGLDGPVAPMLYGSIWIPVVPPAALADPEIDEVYYKIHVLMPDDARRAAFEARNLSVANGSIRWDAPPVPAGVAATLTLEGVGAFGFQMATTRTLEPGEGRPFMEITPAGEKGAGGFALWKASYAWDGASFSQGRGFVDWPAGHWVADAVGSARAPATFHAGTWSFNGTVALPR